MSADVIYLVLLLAGSMLTLAHAGCAPREVLYPCTCNSVLNWLKCGNISTDKLREVFAAQKQHPGGGTLETVELTDYRMSYIPSGILSGLNFRSLMVNTSSLQTFHDASSNRSSFFGVEETLTWLTINYYDRQMGSFDWASVLPLKYLYNIFLSGTFTAFPVPLPKLPTVVNFWLQGTDTDYIAENAFAGLTGVREIRVTGNPIKAYTRNMFPRPAKNLTTFITTSDVITVLPDDYFDEMPSLQYVQIPALAHNIPPLDVTGPTNLQSSRKLTCDCRLKWLLRMRDEGKVNILHGICGRPQHLSWRDVNSLSEKDL